MRVVVAVLTFRRPDELADLLPALMGQVQAVEADVRVLVVDNDEQGSGRTAVNGLLGVDYVVEARPGIAAARNRALREALDDDVLVFIDDDERPDPGWLASLLSLYGARPCDAVVGPVVSKFVGEPSPWVQAGDFYRRRRLPTGTVLDVAATNNLLLDLHTVRRLGLVFDERFGISGGSDTLFTRQLHRRGGQMLWCDEAVVIDRVPAERVTSRWVLQRALRSGNAWSRTSLVLESSPVRRLSLRSTLLAKGGVRLLGGSAQWLVGLLGRRQRHQARGARTLMRGAGIALGALEITYSEYARR